MLNISTLIETNISHVTDKTTQNIDKLTIEWKHRDDPRDDNTYSLDIILFVTVRKTLRIKRYSK